MKCQKLSIIVCICLSVFFSGCTLHFKSTETELDLEPSGLYHLETFDIFKDFELASQSYQTNDITYELCLHSPNRRPGDNHLTRGPRLALSMEMESSKK